MANQPPPRPTGRPLFRLLSQARMGQPPSPPAPAPQPVAPRLPIRIPTAATTTMPASRVPTPPQPAREATLPPPPPPPVAQPQPAREATLPPPPSPPVAQPQAAREATPPPPVATRSQPTPPPSPSPRPAASPRNGTPQQSPRGAKSFSPTPPQTPKPSPRAFMNPEPEETKFVETPPKSTFTQENNHHHNGRNNNGQNNSSKYQNNNSITATSLWKEENSATSTVSGWRNPPGTVTRSGDEEEGLRLITIGGENLGAYMDIGPGRVNSRHWIGKKLHGGQFFNSSKKHATEESETEIEKHGENHKGETKTKGKPMSVVVNSNVQGVNNSLLLGSTCSHDSPGVHVRLSGRRNMKNKSSDDDDESQYESHHQSHR